METDSTVDVASIVEEKVAAAVATITETLSPKVDEIAAMRAELDAANARARLTEALASAAVTDISKGALRKRFVALIEAGAAPSDEDVATAITEASEYEAAMAAKYATAPVFSTTRVEAGDSVVDKRLKRLDLMLDPKVGGFVVDGVRPYRGLTESFTDWSGQNPYEVNPIDIAQALFTRYDSAKDHKRIQESLTTASWGDVFVDALYNRLLMNYRLSSFHEVWRKIPSSIVNVPNFRTQHFSVMGGYADLSTVAEQATYPTATSPGDDDVQFAVAKRGLIEDITMEMIVNDVVGAVQRIPTKMADAAARTLYKFVLNLVTTDNPTLDLDGTALYDSGHSNTDTDALTLASLAELRAEMIEQTRYGTSDEILGFDNAPKYLIVPAEIEMLARRIINPSGTYNMSPTGDTDGSIDPQSFAGMGMEVIVHPYMTDANNWFAVADPAKVDTMVLGFFGSQEPELFTQDNPTVGSVFTADKISFKVRHIYGGEVIDYRPFARNVVS